MSKAGSRMYILRVCQYYGFSKKDLDLLFYSLIVSALVFEIEVWGRVSYTNISLKLTNCFNEHLSMDIPSKNYILLIL